MSVKSPHERPGLFAFQPTPRSTIGSGELQNDSGARRGVTFDGLQSTFQRCRATRQPTRETMASYPRAAAEERQEKGGLFRRARSWPTALHERRRTGGAL